MYATVAMLFEVNICGLVNTIISTMPCNAMFVCFAGQFHFLNISNLGALLILILSVTSAYNNEHSCGLVLHSNLVTPFIRESMKILKHINPFIKVS